MPTTAACPDFAYTPPANAAAVERLVAAGAIPIGKTNLDQFATGLAGVRTPHPVPKIRSIRQWRRAAPVRARRLRWRAAW